MGSITVTGSYLRLSGSVTPDSQELGGAVDITILTERLTLQDHYDAPAYIKVLVAGTGELLIYKTQWLIQSQPVLSDAISIDMPNVDITLAFESGFETVPPTLDCSFTLPVALIAPPTTNTVIKTMMIDGTPVSGCKVFLVPTDPARLSSMEYYEATSNADGLAVFDCPIGKYLIYAWTCIGDINFSALMNDAVIGEAGGYAELSLVEYNPDDYFEITAGFSVPIAADVFAFLVGNLGNAILETARLLGLTSNPANILDCYAKGGTLTVRVRPVIASPAIPGWLLAAALAVFTLLAIIAVYMTFFNVKPSSNENSETKTKDPKEQVTQSKETTTNITNYITQMEANCDFTNEASLLALFDALAAIPMQDKAAEAKVVVISKIAKMKERCELQKINPKDPRIPVLQKEVDDLDVKLGQLIRIPDEVVIPNPNPVTYSIQIELIDENGKLYSTKSDGELVVILYKESGLLGSGNFVQCDPLFGLFLCSYGKDYAVVQRTDLKKGVNYLEIKGLDEAKYAVEIFYRGERVAARQVFKDMLNKKLIIRSYDKIANYQIWWWHTYKWHFYAGAGIATVATGWLLWKAVEKPRAFYVPQFKRSG